MRRWLIEQIPDTLHPVMRSAEQGMVVALGKIYRSVPLRGNRPDGYVMRLKDHSEYQEIYPAEGTSPPGGIGIIRNGRVYTPMGTIITSDNKLVFDISYGGGIKPAAHPIFGRRHLGDIVKLDESIAVLSYKGQENYYHWLLDVLPRLHLLRKSGLSYHHIVAQQDTAVQRETLRLLGVEPRSLITDRRYIEATELIVPILTLPDMIGNQPRWACDFLRESFLPLAPKQACRRIYVSRAKSKTRLVLNESKLRVRLSELGFETVFAEHLSFLEQVAMFSNADFVISPHGAALANIVFCRPGTPVIELFSPSYVSDYYSSLARQLRLKYSHLLGEGKITESPRRYDDIFVNLDQLGELVFLNSR